VIARRLQAILRIRPGEGRTVLLLLAMMVVSMAGAAVGANGVESLFFSRYGPHFLPYLYLALGPLTFAVMMGMSALVSGEAHRFLVRLPVAIVAAVLAARGLLLLDLRWFYPILWLVMMVLWTSQVMGSWGLAGAVSDTRQAKRLFPLYGAGLVSGGVIGGLSTGPLASWIHANNLLFVWAGALTIAALIARLVVRSVTPVRRTRRQPQVVSARRMAQGYRDMWGWPLLRCMSVSLVLFAVLYFTLSLLFAQAATARYPRTDQLAGFLGLFMAASNAAALVASLVLANRLFARFGVPAMVLVLTAIYLAGYVTLAVGATFAALVAFRFVQMVWVNGVWATGWQALFNVVPAERRAQTRLLMDGGPLQVGIVLAGVVLILADRVLDRRQLYIVGAVAAGLGVAATWRARRAYAGALVQALRFGNPDVFRPEQEPFGGFLRDADARAAVLAAASDSDPVLRRVSTEILADLADPDSAEALAPALNDPDHNVRAAAIRGLVHGLVAARPDKLTPLLADPDPIVRALAAEGLLPQAGARRVLAEMSRDARPRWREAAVEALGRARQGYEEVSAGLADPEPSVRRAAALALAAFDPDASVGPLVAALGDRDDSVRRVAAEALARIGEPAQDALVRALSLADLQPGALLALARLPGPPPSGLLAHAREQVDLAVRYHRLWLALGSGRDERLDLLARTVRHRVLSHALYALRAVSRQGDTAAMAVAIENLSSQDPQQRANALEALEAAGEPEVVRPLLALWDSPPSPPGNEDAAVAELMQDEDPWVRASAALAAGAVTGGGLVAVLERLARSDPEPVVRDTAAATLSGGPMETLSTLSLLERVLFLSKVRLFTDLSPEDLKHVAEIASEHTYADGEIIAERGEPGEEMHIVVSGAIRVLVGRNGGPERELARRQRGEYIGEMAIISQESRMASLVCSGAVRTLSLDRKSFERILRERPEVSLGVMRVLSDRLREAEGREAPADRAG
jgi:HEAT repeat protein